MLRPALLTLALAATFGASPASAQALSLPAHAAAAVRAPRPGVSGSVTHRILTLAWTEIRIPARLAAAAAPVDPPVVSGSRKVFTLAWQDVGGDTAQAASIARGPAPECQVTLLVTVPCDRR
jgi:hypothetical protein